MNLGSAKDKTGIRNAYEQRQESTCYFNPQATTEHLRIGTNLPILGPSVPGSVYWGLGLQCLVESATYVCSEHHGWFVACEMNFILSDSTCVRILYALHAFSESSVLLPSLKDFSQPDFEMLNGFQPYQSRSDLSGEHLCVSRSVFAFH